MKQLIYLTLMFAYMQASAQSMTEWQIIGDTIYVEIVNPDGIQVNGITIASDCDTSIVLSQPIIDDFNKKNALCIVKFAKSQLDTLGCKFVYFFVNFDGKMNGRGNLYECPKGYSVTILDSSFIQKSNYPNLYFAGDWGNGWNQVTSFPSIGTPNVIDSSLTYIKGNLAKKYNKKEPYCNQLFWTFGRMVDAQTGDTIIRTDSEGNFQAVSLAQYHAYEDLLLIDSSEIGKYSRDNFKYSDDCRRAYDEDRMLLVTWEPDMPGELVCNLWRGMHTLADTVSLARLSLSPNPAKGSVAVGYELPAGTDYQSSSIVLVATDGRIARTEPLQSASGKQAVPLGGMPRGQYSCIIRTAGGEVIGKENLIVE